MIIDLKYGIYEAEMRVSQYANGRTAIQLYDAEDGQPLVTATVNIPDLPGEDIDKFCQAYERDRESFLLIKDWSENEGIYSSLVAAEAIEPTAYSVPTGYVFARVAFLKSK
jgi:hypothetical protein